MYQVIFYPVGNGDTCQIVLENGKRILLDYRHLAKGEEDESPEIDLKARLQKELLDAKKKFFDVVAFTHGDGDHISGSTDFFEPGTPRKYQGGDRVPIPELWVPAAMLLEEGTHENRADEFIIWRQEARHRLRQGKGIRVFSKPEKLKSWFEENDIPLESRRHLITDAGQIVPGLTLAADGVEFFCHSPFIKHVDGAGDDMRNSCALIFNVRFMAGSNTFDFLAVGDSEWEVLEDIVKTTRAHGNGDRLEWDLYNIPHHCSYLALSDEKGARRRLPSRSYRNCSAPGGRGPTSSVRATRSRTAARRERASNPHTCRRASVTRATCARSSARNFSSRWRSRRSHAPEPIVFNIGPSGITRERK